MKVQRARLLAVAVILATLAAWMAPSRVHADGFAPPDQVKVLPIFVVHSDQTLPTKSQKNSVMGGWPCSTAGGNHGVPLLTC